MTIVDAHHHLWDLTVRDQPWISERMSAIRRSFTVADLRGVAEPSDVVGSVLVQCVADPAETVELLEQAAGDPLIAGVVGFVDLTSADVGVQLELLSAADGGSRLVGVRHVVEGEADPAWLARSDVIRGLHEVARRGLVYDLLLRADQFDAALAAIDAVPDGRFVLDHLGKPPIAGGGFATWARHLEQMSRRSNVTAKLSGLFTEADWSRWRCADLRPFVDHALGVFGPRRMMFGSDWPVCLLATEYGRQIETIELLLGDLSTAERAAVFHGSAVDTYCLKIEGNDA